MVENGKEAKKDNECCADRRGEKQHVQNDELHKKGVTNEQSQKSPG